MSEMHACPSCGGRFQCAAFAEAGGLHATVANLRSDLVIARGRVEELTLNLARVLSETDAHLTRAYADRDRFESEAMALRATVREYLAAHDALDAARCAYLAACRTQDSAAVLMGGRAIAELSARVAAADAALRAIVASDGGDRG